MNDILQSRLEILDKTTLEALKTLFNQCIEQERPEVGEADDLLIGQKYRSYEKAKEILNKVFIELEAFNKEKSNNNSINKGK